MAKSRTARHDYYRENLYPSLEQKSSKLSAWPSPMANRKKSCTAQLLAKSFRGNLPQYHRNILPILWQNFASKFDYKSTTKQTPHRHMPRVELTDDIGDLTPEVTKALEEIFKRYDKDGDSALNEKELVDYFVGCNGCQPTKAVLEELRANFEHNDKGHLTWGGFLDIYSLQTGSSEDETWKDLKKHGYDDNLKLIKK